MQTSDAEKKKEISAELIVVIDGPSPSELLPLLF